MNNPRDLFFNADAHIKNAIPIEARRDITIGELMEPLEKQGYCFKCSDYCYSIV